jgi:hypothetical protein
MGKISEEWWEVFSLDCKPEWIASYLGEENQQ